MDPKAISSLEKFQMQGLAESLERTLASNTIHKEHSSPYKQFTVLWHTSRLR